MLHCSIANANQVLALTAVVAIIYSTVVTHRYEKYGY